MPAATAAEDPPLDPEGVRPRFQGLRVVPWARVWVTPSRPNSDIATLPRMTAPAWRRRAMWAESIVSGAAPDSSSEPCRVGMPRTQSLSFTPIGTPASGPGSSPRATAASMSAAADKAASGSRWTKALTAPSRASIAARAATVVSRALSAPARTASATSTALRIVSLSIANRPWPRPFRCDVIFHHTLMSSHIRAWRRPPTYSAAMAMGGAVKVVQRRVRSSWARAIPWALTGPKPRASHGQSASVTAAAYRPGSIRRHIRRTSAS